MKTCISVAGSSKHAYFWHGNKYVKVAVSDDSIAFGPSKIVDYWKTFTQAGFTTIDAAVEVPDQESQLYVFSGTRYVRIKYTQSTSKESIVYGPYNIADQWKSLVKAGFDTVDAILAVPGNPTHAYVFSGNEFARIKFRAGDPNDELVYGPVKIKAGWKTLDTAGFDTIDAVLPFPGNKSQVYFFSGSQYVRIEFTPDTSYEKIMSGPTRTYSQWKCLNWGW